LRQRFSSSNKLGDATRPVAGRGLIPAF